MISYGLDEAMRFVVLLFRIWFRAFEAIFGWIKATEDRYQGWNGKGEEEE